MIAMRKSARIKHIVLSILFIIASINFTRTTLDIIKSSKRLDTIKNEVSLLDQEKQQMETAIEYKKTDAYVEEKARNDLNMGKLGEKVYVVLGMDSTKDTKVLGTSTAKNEISVSNIVRWKQNLHGWYALFF